MNAPIGVFDSGIGGLTVAKEIMRQIPGESLVYFGDTARVPYGSKSKNTVCKYSKQIAKFLLTQDVKAIVIACNTASALAREELRIRLLTMTRLWVLFCRVKQREQRLAPLLSGVCMMVFHGVQAVYLACSMACIHRNLLSLQ